MSPVLLLAALLATGAVAAWGIQQQREGESGRYDVLVVGPDGPLFAETVEVEDATALSALRAAAAARGWTRAVEEYPGMGAYVRAIGPHEAAGAQGWIYEVARGGETVAGDRSAELFALQKGDALRWSWTRG